MIHGYIPALALKKFTIVEVLKLYSYQKSLPNNGHRSCTKLESVEPYNPHCNPLDQSGFCQEIHIEHSINGKAHPAKSV